jgi:hypothetical protein
MDQIRYKTGEFQSFTATRAFGITNGKVHLGEELEFDGTTVRYAGAVSAMPQLRGAVNSGWLVPTAEYDVANPVYSAPVSANMKLNPTTDAKRTEAKNAGVAAKTMPTVVAADERIVMSSGTHAAATREQNRGTNMRKAASTTVGGAELQEGIPVRTLKTSAKSPKTALSSTAIQEAGNVTITPGEGITEAQMLERMDPEAQAVYLAKKASLRSQYVDEPSSVTVATVKTAAVKDAEGMKLTQHVGGGIAIEDLSGSKEPAKVTKRTEDGISFTNTNGPVKNNAPKASQPVAGAEADFRRTMARKMCPDFPDAYDFAAPAKKKLARLQADFEDRPDVLRAVYAIESDDFKQTLVAEFPQAFQG